MTGDVIDQQDLRRRCMNDPEFVRQMLSIFREYAPKTLRQLHEATAAGDWSAARRHAHTLKGSAANVSAGPLRNVAMDVEKLLDSGKTDDARASLAALDRGMDEVLTRIGELLDE